MEKELTAFTEKIRSFEQNERERILSALNLAGAIDTGAACILLDLGLDTDTIIAALLLAGFRDCKKPSEPPIGQFGNTVNLLFNGVKKIDGLRTNNTTIQEAQNIRNMLFALTDDIRILIIKLAEKLHTLRVLDSFPDDERKPAARESLDIYAPLAGRLGISWLKNEMEDLSLKFLNRDTYQQIKNIVAEKRGGRNQFLEFVQETVKKEAQISGLKIEVKSRAKHFYSIYMKMRKRGKSDSEIHDLSGIRVICDSVEQCYTLLGIVHRLWEPVSGCFDDYIAKPKPNGYQSLHTTVMVELSGENKPLEVQIRTKEMHQMAEHGVASHWLYKKGTSRDVVQPGDIGIVNQLKNWKQEDKGKIASTDAPDVPSSDVPPADESDSSAWLKDIKQEILKKWIYVFTPQGKVIKLVAGATPIDFAYQIHTAVGEHCIGAKANGSIIPLSSQLKNTQIVEILTSPSAHPNLNWLSLAKSSKARSKIRAWLEKNDDSFITDKAEKNIVEKKKPAPESPAPLPAPDKGNLVQTVIKPLSSVLQVRIEDEKNMMVRYARCCSPVTGDEIVGYVSRGRGIIIHRKNCSSLSNNPEFEKRKIEAEWENSRCALVKRFKIEAKFTANLFSEIEGAIQRRKGHLIEGRLEKTGTNSLAGFFTIQLAHADDLKTVIKNIRGIPGIINIQQMV